MFILHRRGYCNKFDIYETLTNISHFKHFITQSVKCVQLFKRAHGVIWVFFKMQLLHSEQNE